MGYASFLEDIVSRLNNMNSMIDNSNRVKAVEVKESRNETQVHGKKENDELKKMQGIISMMRKENEHLKVQLNEKQILLDKLQEQILSIVKKNEVARMIAENRSQEILDNTVNKVNDENAEIILKLKSGILQIGSIINQQNFHKKAENINTIKLIIKRLTGLA